MSYQQHAWLVLAVLCGCQRDAGPTISRVALERGSVEFDDNVKVPTLKVALPVFQLTVAAPRPAFLEELPPEVRRAAEKTEDGTLESHPQFEELTAERLELLQVGDLIGKTVAKMKKALPSPEEAFFAEDARVLYFARAHRGQSEAEDTYEPEQPKLLYVSLRRRVAGLAVDGPGSRFTVAVSNDGKIRGAVYYWKALASSATKSITGRDATTVEQAIRSQLMQTKPKSVVRVKAVEIAYFDDQKTLQPMYRYVAEVMQSPVSVGRNTLYVGYVPLEPEQAEPVRLGGVPVEKPAEATLPSSTTPLPKQTLAGLAVGRYVSFDDHAGWFRDSEDFMKELKPSSGFDELKFFSAQHYETARWLFTSRKDWFVNSVDVALVEAHGYPLGFLAYLDRHNETSFRTDVPLTGYGSEGGGRLKHLILHSCRVLPTGVDYFDNPQRPWARAWWDVFNGLSSVVGYRSSMYIDDGAGAALARNLRSGRAVVPSWFGAVASLNIYGASARAWLETQCAKDEPMGRASAISVCGEGSRANASEGSAGRPTCLEAWWFGDELIPSDNSSTAPKRNWRPSGECPAEGDDRAQYPKSPPR